MLAQEVQPPAAEVPTPAVQLTPQMVEKQLAEVDTLPQLDDAARQELKGIYQEAQRLARQDLYQKVADDFDEFFRRWPDSTEAYQQRFYYAEVLYYNIGDHERAGEQTGQTV